MQGNGRPLGECTWAQSSESWVVTDIVRGMRWGELLLTCGVDGVDEKGSFMEDGRIGQ